MDKPSFKVSLLALSCLSEPLSKETFLYAADIYRVARAKGYTVRSSTDCLIAAIALENGATVWHRDRDYDVIARFTALETLREI